MDLLEYKVAYSTSLNQLAKQIPCARQYLSNVSRGKEFPSYKMACRIESVTNGKVPRTNWYQET